jgi:hypothetical protein
MSQKTAAKNDKPPETEIPKGFPLMLSQEEAGLMHNVCVHGSFPTPEAKMAAASLQAKLEALVPQEA